MTPRPSRSKTRFSFSGWKVDAADIHGYIDEGELSKSLLQGLYILLRDRFPMTTYVFAPHLVRTSKVSRTCFQLGLKRASTPQPLPPVALFPYRTTRARHWVLYAQVEAPSTEEKLFLFKRTRTPATSLDWSNKYIENTFRERLKSKNSWIKASQIWQSHSPPSHLQEI